MTEKFNFDLFQIPQTGVSEPDLEGNVARTNPNVSIRRPVNMKISTFGAMNVGACLDNDYTKVGTNTFKSKGDLEDVNVITADTGVGDVKLNKVTTIRNPYVAGSTVKFIRDDQFFRMTMTRNTGSTTQAASINTPMADVMDTKEATAEGINASTNVTAKKWPTEGWKSFGKKYDFLPYVG